jgi:hypothetical protein
MPTLLPLYMQVVQGFDSLETGIWMLPYALSLSASAVCVTRLAGRFTVCWPTRCSMLLMAAGLAHRRQPRRSHRDGAGRCTPRNRAQRPGRQRGRGQQRPAAEVKSRAQLEQRAFISNGDLKREAEAYGLPEAQVHGVVRINTDERLNALRICFFGLAARALLGEVVARGLPDVSQDGAGSGHS